MPADEEHGLPRKPVPAAASKKSTIPRVPVPVPVPAPAPASVAPSEKPSASRSSSPTRTSSAAAAAATAPVALRLNPSLRDRYNYVSTRLLPAPTYTPLKIGRNRFLALLLFALLIFLILIIALPVGLTQRAKSASSANLPLPSNADVHTGDATYYAPALGACGITSTSDEMIAAISWKVFDAMQVGGNPNANPVCGRKVRATRNGHSVDATIVDRCTGCEAVDLDFSITAFEKLGEEVEGRFLIQWAWL